MAEALFWISAGVVIYAYLGYPLLLILLRALFPNPVKQADIEPFVSILVPAYNEAAFIQAKIDNVLQLDYPKDKLEVAIACDGCQDATVELARAVIARLGMEDRVAIFDYPVNRGKIAVLNESVPKLKGEIVVFSDAAAMFAPDAIRNLMRNYADPRVGAAGGIYRVIRPDSANTGAQEDLYWKYETYLKVLESSLGSVLGLHGHIHSLRKELYPFPEPGTVNDDYVIPVRVLQKDYRVVYEPEAAVYEEAQEMTGFGRRVRIMAGNFQQLREIRDFLHPLRPRCLFYFISHKALRLAVPFAMLLALVVNTFLLDSPLYLTLFWLQVFFYVLAALGSAWKLRPKVLRLPYYFCMVNAAAFAGVYHALTGRRGMAWS